MKKSAQMDWKGYDGSSGMMGGMAGLLGANLEHCLQAALWLIRSCLKFGQYREVEALSNIAVAEAWPEWR